MFYFSACGLGEPPISSRTNQQGTGVVFENVCVFRLRERKARVIIEDKPPTSVHASLSYAEHLVKFIMYTDDVITHEIIVALSAHLFTNDVIREF